MAETKINANQLAIDGNSIVNTSGELTLSSAVMGYLQDAGVYRMNTQTVANATDLLALTGSLHALDLDLSSNTKLTKLTASGTSGSLANLSSVLVSNEAPFNSATSPQLNVSYTGLNKAALVNLFNSMPYNVGYTVVSGPAVSGGVWTKESTSDNCTTSLSFVPGDSDYEMQLFIAGTSGQNTLPVFEFASTRVFARCNSSNIRMVTGSTDTEYMDINVTDFNWLDYRTTGFYFKYKRNKQAADSFLHTLSASADGSTWVSSTSTTSSSYAGGLTNTVNFLRYLGGSAASGSFIDFTKSYLKINDVPWFTGKAAMTKTCDVRGCTGTADLSAGDKAIATDKGWSLTVA